MMVIRILSSRADDEVLVLSLVAECDVCGPNRQGFQILEFTACTLIADLTKYSFHVLFPDFNPQTFRFNASDGMQVANITALTHIYLLSYTLSESQGITPITFDTFTANNTFVDVMNTIEFSGSYGTYGLEKDDLPYDTYGFFSDYTNKVYNVNNGWSARTSGSRPQSSFDPDEWNNHQSVFSETNSDGLKLGTYECTAPPTGAPTTPPTGAPTGALTTPPTRLPTKPPTKYPTLLPTRKPTKKPTVRPTNAHRAPPKTDSNKHGNQPLVNDADTNTPTLPPPTPRPTTPSPTARPTFKPTLARRRKPPSK